MLRYMMSSTSTSSASSGPSSSTTLQQPMTISGVGSQARSHPLFPIIDYLAKTAHQNQQTLLKIDGRLSQQERQLSSLGSAIQELKELQQKYDVSNFSLKSAGYEKSLRCGVADLFCDSLTREVSESSINDLVKKVLKSDIKHRHKVDEALKYCKKMISTFKTEERRRILGIPPCQTYQNLDTKSLAKAMVDYFKATDTKIATYINHLAILRRFVREETNPRQIKSFYTTFKEWKANIYPAGVDWNSLIAEDEAYSYLSHNAAVIETSNSQVEETAQSPTDNDIVPSAASDIEVYSLEN